MTRHSRFSRCYSRTTIVPWYREDDYGEIRKIMSDPVRFPKTFQAWLVRTNREVEALRLHGHSVQRMKIDPGAFVAWCERKRRGRNLRSRLDFAASLLVGDSASDK
jgi:hypothetical protein